MATDTKTEPYVCEECHAKQIHTWLTTREGILIWESVSLSAPGKSMTTPYKDPEGQVVTTKPHWMMANTPKRHITDLADVVVTTAKEVKRFHVSTRMGGQGLSVKVTDGGSRRLRKEVAKAELDHKKPAWYEFDYSSYDNAVILVEDSRVPLTEWVAKQQENASAKGLLSGEKREDVPGGESGQ
jgi:hypothetical protein